MNIHYDFTLNYKLKAGSVKFELGDEIQSNYSFIYAVL